MNSTTPKHSYFGHYTKSGNLMVSRDGFKPFRVAASEIESYLAHLIRMGHTVVLVSKK